MNADSSWIRRWSWMQRNLAAADPTGRPALQRLLLGAAGILSAQAAIQGSNLLVGLLILRQLGVREYGIYVIAGTLIGVSAILANMSLSAAMSFRVARAAEDPARLATIISTASTLQYALIAFALLGVTAIGIAYRHQFDNRLELSAALIIIYVHLILAARLELARSVRFALRHTRPVIMADAAIAGLRLVVIVPVVLLAPWVGALPLLLANAGAQVAGFVTLRMPHGSHLQADRREMRLLLRYMAPLWPENLYYLIQGNVAVMVIAWVGGHSQVAELGALTRLVQIVMILAILNRFLVQPYVARYNSLRDFRHRSLQVLSVYAAGSMLLLLLVWLAPQPFLLVLGAQYQHLTGYVLPVMAFGVVSLGGGLVYWLCLSSGRTAGMSLTIPFGIIIQVSYIALVGLETVGAAVGFMLATALVELVVRLGILAWLSERPSPAVPRSVGID